MSVRTLHIINSLGAGGAERSLAELLPSLRDLGIESTVLVLGSEPHGVEAQVRDAGFPIVHVDTPNRLRQLRDIRRAIRRIDPHVVHTSIFEADILGRIAAVGTGAKVLTSLINTSYEPARRSDPQVRRIRLFACRFIDSVTGRLLTDHFHAISHAVRDSAIARLHLRPESITVIPRGRDRARLGAPSADRRAAARAELGLDDRAKVVLHVGREEFQKAHVVLLDAIAPMLAADRDVHLVLAGRRGNASQEIDQRIDRIGSARIHRLGHVDNVPDLLTAADVFAFPSHYEGQGGAVLEAMAMGVPIVATDLPPFRENLDGVATFVPPGCSEELRSAIEGSLRGGREVSSAAVEGRSRFEERFDHGRLSGEMASLIQSVSRGRTPG